MRVRHGLFKLFGLCVLAGVLVAGMLFPAVGSLGVVSNRASDAVNSITRDILTQKSPLVTTVTDRDGEPISYFYEQDRTPAAPGQISDAMKAAIISIEDRRFFEHEGVDWPGTVRAAITNQASGEVSQGGSTLTQQFVKNYLMHVIAGDDPVKQAEAVEQTPARKIREIRIALQLEQRMGKEEILARYLNVVPFGNQTYGISSAARTYFNTTPDQLTIAQSALLAGMVNMPSALNPETNPEEAEHRRNMVIDAMEQQGRITRATADQARQAPLGVASPLENLPNGCVGAGPEHGFFCQYVMDYLQRRGFTEEQLKEGGYTIRTTLDKDMSAEAKRAAEQQVPKDTEGIANVMSVVEPGEDEHPVRALVANRDYGFDTDEGQSAYSLPSSMAMFGAGSVYKVFTAAAALEHGLGINTRIPAPGSYTSQVYKNGTAPYTVGNAEGTNPGPRSVQQALATSPNTAFVALQERVGLDETVNMASRLGMRQTLNQHSTAGQKISPNGTNGTSQAQEIKQDEIGAFTLGYAPTNPLEVSNVGATIFSGGTWCPPTPVEEITDRNGDPISFTEEPCDQAVPTELADALAVGMSQDDAPGGTAHQAAQSAGWDRPLAAKTGTTEEHRSAGFLGATPHLSASVLTFSDGDSPRGICDTTPPTLCGDGNIYGGKVPARTWFGAMKPLHEDLPPQPLPDVSSRYSGGGEEEHAPYVMGMPGDEAEQALTDAGYEVDRQAAHSERPQGTVVSQSRYGAVSPGETIELRVSTGYIPSPAGGSRS